MSMDIVYGEEIKENTEALTESENSSDEVKMSEEKELNTIEKRKKEA